MSITHTQITRWYEEYLIEHNKFNGGNSSAGIRAGNALSKLEEFISARQIEIKDERKNIKGE